ncbi:hypothetical protein [Serratia silvae]|uniref:Uncharacterized protein n=1 Tax=Serratia silvae TaxID=2824122 RepID=A0ABT0K7G0_9GAMM|nr:hypothetical protein [Serratia silvae]MCL1027679.1 hypothetical protein [Serratia silvae]
MSLRKDITGPERSVMGIEFLKYGLVYTDNLGWIDLGHANPEGALSLWWQMINPRFTQGDFFRVNYTQSMSKRVFSQVRLKTGVTKSFLVKRGLHHNQLMGIAYAIFLDTSHAFETLQYSFPYNIVTDSGYSAEDLISNILGFHSAIFNINYINVLKARDTEYALKIWDHYGPVGNYKNYELKPLIFPDPEDHDIPHKPYKIPLPDCLSRIRPISDKRLVTELFL